MKDIFNQIIDSAGIKLTAWLTKTFTFLIAVLTALSNLFGFGGGGDLIMNKNSSLGCADALGREIISSGASSDKQVGIFYFLWQGEHGTGGPYDNSKIAAAHPEAVLSEQNWLAAGGGAVGEHHFWGEPLFGYYTSQDTWVMRKHVQMLTDAGVDFIVMDTTNACTYTERTKSLIGIWYEYLLKGWNVPKIAFYTNTLSGETMNSIYDELYNNPGLKAAYPRLDELWYCRDGKPMIIGKPDDPALRGDVKAYFRIKESQWPTEDRKADGFPWMEFDRSLTYKAVYGEGLKREIMSVSAAQHSDTCRFSATAWYGANDRTRSWHNGANDTHPNAAMYGFNFAEQWDFAMSFDPEVIFVTGFNEWVAQRQPSLPGEPIVFVDSCDTNGSRDVEPMNGLLGDNYYMQLVNYIAEFKGTAVKKEYPGNVSIDMNGGFDQWNSADIKAVYADYTGDSADRNCKGFGNIVYTDTSGLNDIQTMKVAKDNDYLYFYADTAEPLTPAGDENRMNLLLRVDKTAPNGSGYDFRIYKTDAGSKAKVAKYGSGGFDVVGEADTAEGGNQIILRIDRSLLGLDGKKAEFQFKWTDNCDYKDVYSFYTTGDSAPYGRLNYIYSE